MHDDLTDIEKTERREKIEAMFASGQTEFETNGDGA
jgi:hypothetical protein